MAESLSGDVATLTEDEAGRTETLEEGEGRENSFEDPEQVKKKVVAASMH